MKKIKNEEKSVLYAFGYGYLHVNRTLLVLLGPEKSIFLSQLREIEADVKEIIKFEIQEEKRIFPPGKEPIDGFFYCSKKTIKDKTGLTYKQQNKICTELEKLKLIKTKIKKFEKSEPALDSYISITQKYYKINHSEISKILLSKDILL